VFTSCESPATYAGLTVGIEYTFAVYGVISSVAGEVVSVEWEVIEPPDTTPPDTSLGAGAPPAVTTATSATFSFAATEPGSSFLCSLDSAEPAACSSPMTLSALAVGVHTFTVAGRDAAGNVDATPVSHSWEVQAPPPDCSAVATLTATADSWVDRASTADTNGSETVLRVRSRSSNRQRRALVGFTLPSPPPGCEVATATLRLYASSAQSGRTLRAEALAGPWTEAAVNWNNQPAVTGVFATTSSGSGWRTWNVAPHVEAALTGGPNFGFLVRDAVETSDHEQQFTSREGTADRRPQLVLTFEPGSGPPPTTTTTTTTSTTTTTTAPPTTTTTTTTAPTTTTTTAPTTTSTTTTTTTAPPTTTTTTTPPSACAATTVTLSATGDSWIDSGSPGQRKGDDSNLKVISKSGANNRALVRFTLPAVPAGCVVKAATLRLYAKSYKTGRTLQAYALGGPWTEADVTWANQPPTTGSAATTASGSGWRQWNVLTQVTGMYAGTNNGFLIRDATENNDHEQQFDSREASNKPQLVVQFGAP
jgi:hypothetical protein